MRVEGVSEILQRAYSEGRNFLFEHEAKEICRFYNLPVTKGKVASSEEEAVEEAKGIGFPVVLKIVSPQILHKSDVGGVILNVKDEQGVKEAYRRIMSNVKERKPEAEIEGIYVQEMAPSSTEVIVGATKDPTFGATIMFGIGGIFVEVLKDVSFRLVPVTRLDAEEMIHEIRSHKILEGVRGMPRADESALVEVLLNTSKMLMECPEIAELDMNPILVYEEGAKIVDARIILEERK
ncbi:MAG: acetate--CoA ligase family protein [Candidatus Bathyarchaeia archaeon]